MSNFTQTKKMKFVGSSRLQEHIQPHQLTKHSLWDALGPVGGQTLEDMGATKMQILRLANHPKPSMDI